MEYYIIVARMRESTEIKITTQPTIGWQIGFTDLFKINIISIFRRIRSGGAIKFMNAIEKRIVQIIDERRQDIIDFAEDIFSHPELGFKERRTAELIANRFESLGLYTRKQLAITGVKGYLKSCDQKDKGSEINIAVIGEMDAVRSPHHPKADSETGAAHSCGHHAQLAAMFGAAIALSNPEVAGLLDGNVTFFAVPAEEFGEIEFKISLRKKGLIEFLGGKSELIRLGEFDDIDIALTHHSLFGETEFPVVVGSGSTNGFVSKLVRYIGKESHAAASPHEGINALNAAVLGLSALNFQRETFKDSDCVRLHPIITKGGDLVNVIPGEAVIEILVRARTLEAILDANAKATRAFEAGAYAVGARVEITDLPGYLPRIAETTTSPFLHAAQQLVGMEKVKQRSPLEHGAFSSDVGDISHLLPVFSFSTGGTVGESHSANFAVVDPEMAYILPAKIMAITVYNLLKDGASKAREIKNDFKPVLTKEEYIDYVNSIIKS